MEVDRLLQRRGPILGGEASTIEKSSSVNSEVVIVCLDGAVLGGAIGAGRFHKT